MSKLVVMKFGGTSVASLELIARVSSRISKYIKQTGNRLVVVVSAMAGETERLIELASGLSEETAEEGTKNQAYHQLLASGEQVSSALTVLALRREGVRAQPLVAHQIGLRTRHVRGQDVISGFDSTNLDKLVGDGVVPVVAGFQAVGDSGAITTLGRGGSDLSAIALAGGLAASVCYIMTDVDGIYSASPAICRDAEKLHQLSYDEVIALADGGAKVLQPRSVEFARKLEVSVVVCSSFADWGSNCPVGTEITAHSFAANQTTVSAISHLDEKASVARVTLVGEGLRTHPEVGQKALEILSREGIRG